MIGKAVTEGHAIVTVRQRLEQTEDAGMWRERFLVSVKLGKVAGGNGEAIYCLHRVMAEAEEVLSPEGVEVWGREMKPTVFDLIRSEKVNVVIGSWKTGKIPPAAFPINRPRSIPTGGDWRWRLCEFDALNYHCRVIIRVNFEKQKYHSYLSIDTKKSVKVICHHDLHVGDKGWHCHFAKGYIEDVMEGVLRDRDCYTMFEAEPSLAQSQLFNVTEDSALSKAAMRYRFEARGTFI